MSVRCIIIDDLQECHDDLNDLLEENFPEIQITERAYDAKSGLKLLLKGDFDFAFLDVELGSDLIFDILDKVPNKNFQIIFSTVHSKYAVKAFDYAAFQYLLKPLEELKFIEVVTSLVEKISKKEPSNISEQYEITRNSYKQPDQRIEKMALPVQNGLIFVNPEEILYCEADANYCLFFFENGEKQIISKPLKEYSPILESLGFIRIHKSYIVNPSYVTQYVQGVGGSVILKNGRELLVSKRRKVETLSALKSFGEK